MSGNSRPATFASVLKCIIRSKRIPKRCPVFLNRASPIKCALVWGDAGIKVQGISREELEPELRIACVEFSATQASLANQFIKLRSTADRFRARSTGILTIIGRRRAPVLNNPDLHRMAVFPRLPRFHRWRNNLVTLGIPAALKQDA